MKGVSLKTKLKNVDVLFKLNLSHVHGQIVSETETSKIFSIKAIENVEDELSKYRDKMNTLLQEKGPTLFKQMSTEISAIKQWHWDLILLKLEPQ